MKNTLRMAIGAAIIMMAAVYLIYFSKFNGNWEFTTSIDQAVWGQFGDFIGGVLNPLLSFISIVLLVNSLTLQFQANERLKDELKYTRQAEKLRSFQLLFFNLIDSQKKLFDGFKINNKGIFRNRLMIGSHAVLYIENQIDRIRATGADNREIGFFLEEIDTEDQIFGIVRAFYILVKIVDERLSDANGFTLVDRTSHLESLINFTDFSQFRLVLLCIQHLDYASARYLSEATEFKKLVADLGINIETDL